MVSSCIRERLIITPSILFVAGTPFQILISYIISRYIAGGKDCYLVSACLNHNANKMASRLRGFRDVKIIDREVGAANLNNFFRVRHNATTAKKVFKECKPKTLILFKDGSPLESSFIDRAKAINTRIVLVEEGLAIYSEDQRDATRFTCKLKKYLKKIIGYPATYPGVGNNNSVHLISAFKIEMLPKSKTINKILVPFPTVPPANEVFDSFVNGLGLLECQGQGYYQKASYKILYLGQPLSELGIISRQRERDFLEILFQRIKRISMEVIVKPHPWEHISKYADFGLAVHKNNYIPAEIVAYNTRPSIIITPYSSAGTTTAEWFGTRSIFLYHLLDIELEKRIRTLLLDRTGFSHAPSSWDDFSLFLKNGLVKQEQRIYASTETYIKYVKDIIGE